MAPSRATVRFGFRESRQVGPNFELNGVLINYRGDNLQPADYDSIDNGGRGDAIDTLPGFLRPSATNAMPVARILVGKSSGSHTGIQEYWPRLKKPLIAATTRRSVKS